MARKRRIWYPGAIYHVMSRGNRKAPIFADSSDYIRFLEYLLMIKNKIPFRIHSLCLMTNHFHISLETFDVELWKIMHKILSLYAHDYNCKYNYSGHLFEGRYTAQIIEDERYFLEVSRYIHLNPVKAMIVDDPFNYEYSSYRNFIISKEKIDKRINKRSKAERLIDELTDTGRILEYFENNDKYKDFVEEKISHEEHELLIQKDMREDDMWLPIVVGA